MEAAFPVILAVDQDSTTRGFIEPTDNVNERTLAAASGADDARFRLEVSDEEADGRTFTRVKVRPCFV